MTDRRRDKPPQVCIGGMLYFEVFLPREGLDTTLGEEHFVDQIDIGLGGALNPASVLSALGIETTVAYPRGEGLSDVAVAHGISQLDIGVRCWSTGDDPAISLIQSQGGDRGFTSCADIEALRDCPSLRDFDWVHIPGLTEAGELGPRLAEARRHDTVVSVSGSWAPTELDELLTGASSRWDLLILNRKEARRATDRQASTTDERLQRLRHVADDVIITGGQHEIAATIQNQSFRVDVVPSPHFVDATGAGDAFGAGYIAARLHDLSAPRALAFANDVAGVVVGLRGGVVQDRAVFDSLRPSLSDFSQSTQGN